jgi:UDP-N-acetylmuramoyl-tripeptide--D-alanyl-D-alanine ligase
MRAALNTLASVARSRAGRPVAVLGHMAELGESAPAEHDALGQLAVRLGISRVIAVGEQARPIQRGTDSAGPWDGAASWVPDADGAVEVLRAELRPGDVVLVKASRAASLERVALSIVEDVAGTREGGGT